MIKTEAELQAAIKDKENYSRIVAYFRTRDTLSEHELHLLIGIIEQISPEIYEHYRALQDIFRTEIRKKLGSSDMPLSEELVRTIKKGCAAGTLLSEKYTSYL